MKKLLILFAVGVSSVLQAQTADLYVIGALGGEFSNANIDVNYTAGEAMITTLNNGITVTQGFHQPAEAAAGLEEVILDDHLSLYPNPAGAELNIYLKEYEGMSNEMQIEIFSASGAMVFSGTADFLAGQNSTIQINTSQLLPGHYLIQLQSEDGKFARSKFVKQ